MSASRRKAPPIVDAREWVAWDRAIAAWRAGDAEPLAALIGEVRGPDNARQFLADLVESWKAKRTRGRPRLTHEQLQLRTAKETWFGILVELERYGLNGERLTDTDLVAVLEDAQKVGPVKTKTEAIQAVANLACKSEDTITAALYGKRKRKAPP